MFDGWRVYRALARFRTTRPRVGILPDWGTYDIAIGPLNGKCHWNKRFRGGTRVITIFIACIKNLGVSETSVLPLLSYFGHYHSMLHPPHTMQYHPVVLNPLLVSFPTGATYFPPVPVQWDIRRTPHHTARVAGQVASANHLAQLATSPGVTTLRILSDLLAEDWIIMAHNPTGVTIEDVLFAIYTGLYVPLTASEWNSMSPPQRARVERVFYARCEASRDFDRTRYGGILRMDCLLHTTVFAGLSSLVPTNNRWEVVLTLSRDFNGRTRSLPEGQRAG